jgi:geranylgeranyl pyrophosphate synthase
LLAAVREAGGVERARSQARALVDDALAALALLPPTPHRRALEALALFSIQRVS